jgi:hypothetical protein
VLQSCLRQRERGCGRFQYAAATGMHDDPGEVAQDHVMPGKKMVHSRSQLITRALWNVRAQDDAKAIIFVDQPASSLRHICSP